MDSKKMREHKDSVIKHCLQHLSCVSNSYSDSPSNNWTCLQRPIDDKKKLSRFMKGQNLTRTLQHIVSHSETLSKEREV